jgi:hypothetical protein
VSFSCGIYQLNPRGAKGVLSVWPDLAGPNEIRLRKSLIKFESNLVALNVVRVSFVWPLELKSACQISSRIPESAIHHDHVREWYPRTTNDGYLPRVHQGDPWLEKASHEGKDDQGGCGAYQDLL